MTKKENPTFGHNDYEIMQRDILYQGIFRMVRFSLRHRLFKGGWSETLSREIMERRTAAAAILPYDPILDRIILIEQFRPGTFNDPVSPWQIEIPAGVLAPNEKPEDLAVREAKEEAGCDISNIELICDYFVSSGCSNEYIHIFYGEVDASHIGGIHGLENEHEDIRVLNIPAEEALAKLHKNEFKNAPVIIALQWFELNRKRIIK